MTIKNITYSTIKELYHKKSLSFWRGFIQVYIPGLWMLDLGFFDSDFSSNTFATTIVTKQEKQITSMVDIDFQATSVLITPQIERMAKKVKITNEIIKTQTATLFTCCAINVY